jgi:hypothetical protein
MEKVLADGGGKSREISLGGDFGAVVVKVNGAIIEVGADSHVIVSTRGGVELQPAANDGLFVPPVASSDVSRLLPPATPEIGAIESTGEHKGEIYGGIYPDDNKPIWFSAAPRLMNHYNAAAWATEQGGSLPTREQGDYLTTLKGKGGAFTEMFNRGGSFSAGSVWLAKPYASATDLARLQRLSDGNQDGLLIRSFELPVLCVRR